MSAIDMHAHLLPGVDNGCKTFDESMSILKICKENGIEEVYLTPHVNNPKYLTSQKEIFEMYNSLKPKLESVGVKVHLGSEIYLTPDLDINRIIPMGITSYVLVETNHTIPPTYLKDSIFKLQLYGYDVILSHVERYKWLKDLESLQFYLKERKVKFSIDYSAYRDLRKYPCLKLWLNRGWIEFIGSNVHGMDESGNVIQKNTVSDGFNKGL